MPLFFWLPKINQYIMNLNKLKKLIKGYEEGKLTPEEFVDLEAWFHSLNYQHKDIQGSLSDNEFEEKLFQTFQSKLEQETAPVQQSDYGIAPEHQGYKTTGYGKWLAIAASVIIALGAGLWSLNLHNKPVNNSYVANNKILPGGAKAFLTLSNGAKITLNKLPEGYQKAEQGYRIVKHKGRVVYEAATTAIAANNNIAEKWNTITTPKGGEFEIKLPDGSTVLLNAESSLRFPLTFTGKGREVYLTGEAYFEVAKLNDAQHKRIPFRVITEEQHVEVLGTHFNINAYKNEDAIKTTLVEGSVKVTQAQTANGVLLVPGQQSAFVLNKNRQAAISIAKADINEVLAWKSGWFMFSNRNLKSIMQQLERWYDISVDYTNLPDKKFNGNIPRSLELAKVLRALEKTSNYKFKIETLKNTDGSAERRLVMDK
jgi:transmembrane sensor